MRILVAEQDPEQRQSLINFFHSLGHKTQEALTAREVTEHCRGKCPDQIFLGFDLSGVAGIEIIRQIRQLGGHAIWVPIELMGKNLSEAEMLEGIEAGADDCLNIPIPPIRLLARIRSAERQLNLKEEVFQVAHHLVVANRALENIVTQDTLTGLGNSNSFDDALERDWFEAKKTETPLTLIIGDLDFFQAYNQSYGAVKGDEAIKQVGEALRKNLPKGKASIARIAGKTFAILLPNIGQEEGLGVAENLRKAVGALQIPHISSGASDHVTASFGVSIAEPGNFTSPWDLKEAANYALFQAKHRGKNRVFFVSAAETSKT